MKTIRTQAANLITGTRLICAVFLAFCPAFSPLFYVLYALCGVSDILDGFIARRLKTESKRGARLDTIADAVFAVVVLVRFLNAAAIPLWLIVWAILIAGIKAGSMLLGLIKHHRFMTVHSLLNKLTGIALFFVPPFIGAVDCRQAETAVLIAGCTLASAAAVREFFLIYHGKSIE